MWVTNRMDAAAHLPAQRVALHAPPGVKALGFGGRIAVLREAFRMGLSGGVHEFSTNGLYTALVDCDYKSVKFAAMKNCFANTLGRTMTRKLTLEYIHALAKKFGGRCLSETYENNHTELDWICKEKHIWSATVRAIQHGVWCPECDDRVSWTIEDMQEFAKQHGGKCLSKKFLGTKVPLIWECRLKHTWPAIPKNVIGNAKKKGTWCRICSGKAKGNLEEAIAYAHSHGGRCLSTDYVDRKTPMEFICDKGHPPFRARFGSMLAQNSWCEKCAGRARGTVEEMQALALSRGGKFLSTEYSGANEKHKWQCSDFHEWDATPGAVKFGSWCPQCNINYGEEICRFFFEHIFSASFPKTKPGFLRGENGRRHLELDGYNEDLGIAFEHHGRQHYEFTRAFHRNEEHFLRVQKRDAKKVQMCVDFGIKLIVVPDVPGTTPICDVPRFMLEQLESLGVAHSASADAIMMLDINVIYKSSAFAQLLELVAQKGGKCLSRVYLGCATKLKFLCSSEHEFDMRPDAIKQGQWCPTCAGNARRNIEEMRAIAERRGGECISEEYLGIHTQLLWKCGDCQHIWPAMPSDVKGTKRKKGSWCPLCSHNRKRTIEEMQAIAKLRGGRCLSTEYVANNQKLIWECIDKHRWEAIPNSIMNGTWCPICANFSRVKNLKEHNALRFSV